MFFYLYKARIKCIVRKYERWIYSFGIAILLGVLFSVWLYNPVSEPMNYFSYYFYAIIGSSCQFGMFLGYDEMVELKGNYLNVGARIRIAPMKQRYAITANLAAVITIQFLSVYVIYLIFLYLLKVPFSHELLLVGILLFCGTLCSIGFGMMMCICIPRSPHIMKIFISLLIMLESFLSGILIYDLNYYMLKKIPMLSYVNPASLVTDGLYRLSNHQNLGKYMIRCILLLSFSVLFYGIAYLYEERSGYEGN